MKDITQFIYQKLEEMLINSSDEFNSKNKEKDFKDFLPFHIPNNILKNIETDVQYKNWILDIVFNHLSDDIVLENFSKIISVMTFGTQKYLIENLIKKIDSLIEEDFDIEDTKKLFQKSLLNEIKNNVLDMYIIVDPIDLGSYYTFLQGVVYEPNSIEVDYNKNLPKDKKLNDFYDFNSEYEDYFNERDDEEDEEKNYEKMKSNKDLEDLKYSSSISNSDSDKESKIKNDQLVKETFESILSLSDEKKQEQAKLHGNLYYKVERNTTRLTNAIFDGKQVNEETIDYMTDNHNYFNSALISVFSRFLIKELTETKDKERLKNKEKLFYFFKNLSDGNSELFKEALVKFKKFLIEKEQKTFLNQNEQTKDEIYYLINHVHLRREDKNLVLKVFNVINHENKDEKEIKTRSDYVFEEKKLKPKMIKNNHLSYQNKEQEDKDEDELDVQDQHEEDEYIHHIKEKKAKRLKNSHYFKTKQEEVIDFSTTEYKDIISNYIHGGKWNSVFEKEKLFNNENFIKEFVFLSFEKSEIKNFKLEEMLPSLKKLKKQKENRNGKDEEVFIEDSKDEKVKMLEKHNNILGHDLNIISMFYAMSDKEFRGIYFKYINAYVKQHDIITAKFDERLSEHDFIVELYVNACCAFLSENKSISSDKEFYEESKKGIMKALVGKYLY